MSKPPKMPRFAHELFLIQVHPRSSPFIYYLTFHLTLVFCSKRHTNQSKHTQNGKKCISSENIFTAHPAHTSHPTHKKELSSDSSFRLSIVHFLYLPGSFFSLPADVRPAGNLFQSLCEGCKLHRDLDLLRTHLHAGSAAYAG